MSKSKVKNEHYVNIQGWMINELHLKGNELLVYAIIYGFSQAEDQVFEGSLQYLADWCGATKQGILKNLKSLLEKGYILKSETLVNGIMYCAYACVPIESLIVLNSVEYPIKHSLTNNIVDNKETNNKTISKDIVENFSFGTKKEKPKKESMYSKCISLIVDFTDDSILRDLLIASLKLFLENSRESDKPFYTNHFKGKLNDLKKLSEDNYEQRKIVQQTLDKGWNGFYAIKTDTIRKKTASTDLGYTSNRAKRGDNSGEKF